MYTSNANAFWANHPRKLMGRECKSHGVSREWGFHSVDGTYEYLEFGVSYIYEFDEYLRTYDCQCNVPDEEFPDINESFEELFSWTAPEDRSHECQVDYNGTVQSEIESCQKKFRCIIPKSEECNEEDTKFPELAENQRVISKWNEDNREDNNTCSDNNGTIQTDVLTLISDKWIDKTIKDLLGIPTNGMIKKSFCIAYKKEKRTGCDRIYRTLYSQCGAFGFECKDLVGHLYNKCQMGTLKFSKTECEEK